MKEWKFQWLWVCLTTTIHFPPPPTHPPWQVSSVWVTNLHFCCCRGGATGGPCPSEDGWKFNAAASEWTELEQCASPRIYSSMAMLPSSTKTRRAVLYGGKETSKSVLAVSPVFEPCAFIPLVKSKHQLFILISFILIKQ